MIRADDIFKSYNGEPCLRGLSLHVAEGEFLSVMGESGSGKSTLLEILAGVRTPDKGSVRVAGEDVCALSGGALAKFRRTVIGVVYQQFRLISTLTAEDNIRLPLLLERVPKAEIARRVSALAEALGIGGMLHKYPEQLSGGQQQRVAIARAVAYSPRVLFLDEPTGSLDSENSGRVLAFLSELNRERGTTIVQITHSAEAAARSSRTVHIRDGVILP